MHSLLSILTEEPEIQKSLWPLGLERVITILNLGIKLHQIKEKITTNSGEANANQSYRSLVG